MKVLHVIPSVASVRGGPSQAVIEMVKALRQAGIAAEIATTNDNGPDLLEVPLHQRTEYQQAPIWFFPRFSPQIHAVREFAFSSSFTRWLWSHIRDYDLVHIHAIFSYPSTVAMTIARRQQVPYIVRPLGQLCHWSLQQSQRKKQLYLNLIERDNLNHSAGLHLTSWQEQQDVAQMHLSPTSFVLPHGLAIPAALTNARQQLRQRLQLPEDEPILLFLSRLHAKKGLDYLIPALGKLTDYRFTLVLAGSGSSDYEQTVRQWVNQAGLNERTHFTGFVTGELKNLLLQGADLYALTSHSENFGIAVLEALAAGLPVLVTPGVALASIVQEHQLGYVTELNITTIAQTLDDYFSYPEEAKAMGQRACQFILENYTWDKIAVRMIEVYQAILNASPVS
jgi:glycosyltransferase involved in cell wall biosynthesis